MSKDSSQKHPDGFVSICVLPREIGKVIYPDQWADIAKRLQKRSDLRREYEAAIEAEADAATVASISSRLSAAKAAVRPEWGRLLIEADRLITSDVFPLYRYHRDGRLYPVPKGHLAGDNDQHVRARRLMLLTGKFQKVINHEQRGKRQVDLRSLIRNSPSRNVEKVPQLPARARSRSLGAEESDLVIVLERDLREAVQQIKEDIDSQSDAERTPELKESRREERKRETKERYKRWYELAQEIKKGKKWTRPTKIANMIAKQEKSVDEQTVRRRLDEYYPGWAKKDVAKKADEK